MKRCCSCKEFKILSEFHRCKNAVQAVSSQCKICEKSYRKKYYSDEKNRLRHCARQMQYQSRPEIREKNLIYWKTYSQRPDIKQKRKLRSQSKDFINRRFIQTYGITLELYDNMFEEQGGVCAICGNPPSGVRLAVDHCHSTGKVRGLLCRPCNSAIGFVKDDPKILEAAANYLSKSKK